jgi:hypothetical protein
MLGDRPGKRSLWLEDAPAPLGVLDAAANLRLGAPDVAEIVEVADRAELPVPAG